MRFRCVLAVVVMALIPTHLARRMEHRPPMAAAVAAVVTHPFTVLRGTVDRNATLASMLSGNVSPTAVHGLVQAARPVYDLARISVGRPYGLVLGPNGMVQAFSYGIDEIRLLRVERTGEALTARLVERAHEVRTERVEGVISSSLFGAIDDAGEEDQLALDMADIFAWDVDFNTELQRGDWFRLAVEKVYVEGQFARYGHIVAAELMRGERVLSAVRFEGAQGVGYFNLDGLPLRKAFLRSPIKFTRVSSGFTRARLHPILGTTRPHLGVDLAAPTGTPVRASGDGMVVAAGRSGGYGNVVKIRHPNGYETLYGHLSRIGVRRGARVAQGELIGAVGMTGLATGPHLDYRMSKDGVFVNPLRIQSPPADPIGPEEMADFSLTRDRVIAFLAPPPDRESGGPTVVLAATTDLSATSGTSP